MDSENREGKALSFSVDGRDVKNRNKRNYNSLWNIRKHYMVPIEISKLPQANCVGAEIDETCSWFREQCRFFTLEKNQGRRKVTRLCENWHMCADLVLRLGISKTK